MQASEILNNAETGSGLWILIMKTKQEHEEWDMHYIKKMHAFCAIWDYINRRSHKTERKPIQIHDIAREAGITDVSPESQDITAAECTLCIWKECNYHSALATYGL